MRIRKNAERVVEGKKSYLICQLNRTPWDDDSFFSQGYWDNDLPLNNCFDDSVPASASVPTSNESMEQSLDYLENSHSPEKGADDGEIGGSGGVIPKLPPPLPPKKAAAAASTFPKKRGRPKKPALPGPTNRNSNSNNNHNNNNNNNNIDSNPYQFYYYSGFGPSWGKRRGETRFNGLAPDPSNCEMLGSSSKSNVSEEEEEEDDVMVIDDDENNVNDNKNDNNNCKSSGIVESLDSVLGAERELDFIDDDEEEDEDEDVEDLYVGKRARKPIKARSLKSLM